MAKESTLQIRLSGSVGVRQGFPPFRRRFATLTRASRSRQIGLLSERRPILINWGPKSLIERSLCQPATSCDAASRMPLRCPASQRCSVRPFRRRRGGARSPEPGLQLETLLFLVYENVINRLPVGSNAALSDGSGLSIRRDRPFFNNELLALHVTDPLDGVVVDAL